MREICGISHKRTWQREQKEAAAAPLRETHIDRTAAANTHTKSPPHSITVEISLKLLLFTYKYALKYAHFYRSLNLITHSIGDWRGAKRREDM